MALSPMMKQYFEIKEEHQDKILFFRLGDFYEMFFEDAHLASKELELTLTGRDCGQEERAPMCGVPYHSAESYIARLIEKGYKVAICEQLESVSSTKGPVRRDVTRIVSPGTVIEGSMLDESKNNFLATIYFEDNKASVAFVDITTGNGRFMVFNEDVEQKVIDEISKVSPSEIIFNSSAGGYPAAVAFIKFKSGIPHTLVSKQFCFDGVRYLQENIQLKKSALGEKEDGLAAVAMVVQYLLENHLDNILKMLRFIDTMKLSNMQLDFAVRRNLELTANVRNGDKKGSLFWIVDKTKTSMGRRLLRNYIEQPLFEKEMIRDRLDLVEELLSDFSLRQTFDEAFSGVYDIERIVSRIVFGSAEPKEVLNLLISLWQLPQLKELAKNLKSKLGCEIENELNPLTDLAKVIDDTLAIPEGGEYKEGEIIKAGFNAELDELKLLLNGGKGLIFDMEAREREASGIKNLKIGYNKVFGYYLEVTKSFIDKVPERYIRKQTLTNAERYITEELKEYEEKVLYAKEKILTLESEIFSNLKKHIAQNLQQLQQTASAVAKLDVFCCFAAVSLKNNYCKPTISNSGKIEITEGRHPVVEAVLDDCVFVPNDTNLDMVDNRVMIITGPNMAGKSTYMRQTAIICIMMQMGCFVPAKRAHLPLIDRIFTRVGASDDLFMGQSTFMVEMSEVAFILNNATIDSLIILDEVGRGTSTFDGMSIAKAVVEYIADTKKIGAKTMFATHYHEITDMEDEIEGIVNVSTAVKKRGEDIIFLRRIVKGGADESFGIEVAKLAGVPNIVIKRAYDILKTLESESDKPKVRKNNYTEEIETGCNEEVLSTLAAVDLQTLSPLEALNLLNSLQNKLK